MIMSFKGGQQMELIAWLLTFYFEKTAIIHSYLMKKTKNKAGYIVPMRRTVLQYFIILRI
jgi:hypothetical protein